VPKAASQAVGVSSSIREAGYVATREQDVLALSTTLSYGCPLRA